MFRAVPAIRDKMETLKRVGSATSKSDNRRPTLSGGEAQRVKLSKELSRRATGRTPTSSTNPPPVCILKTCASCWRCCANWSTKGTPWW